MLPTRNKTIPQQLEALNKMKDEFTALVMLGYTMVQCDECLFSVRQYMKYHWAPVGKRLLTKQRWPSGKVVVVCGFITTQHGKLMMKVAEQRSFKGIHICRFLHQLRNRLPDDDICLFWDNCKIHLSHLVRDCASDNNIVMLQNIPYRPDLNGIERVWAVAKRHYRDKLAQKLVMKGPYSNLQLVNEALDAVTDDQCKEMAASGWMRLFNSSPIDYDEGEEQLN
jgi:hypothetical protein